LGQIAAGACC